MNLLFYPAQIAAYRLLQTMIKERLALDKDARFDLYSTVEESIHPDKSNMITSDLWSEATFFLQAGERSTFIYLLNSTC